MRPDSSRTIRRFQKLVCILAVISGCGRKEHGEVMSKAVSPDSTVDAYLLRFGGPATVRFSYVISLVPHNQPAPSGEEGEFVAEDPKGLTATWDGSRILDINYDSARIYRFTNFSNPLPGGLVELRLKPRGRTALP